MAFTIFGMKFGKEYNPPMQKVLNNDGKSLTFSTPFMNVGSGNLSLPQINKYYTLNKIVMFGEDNLYPQLLNQMYFTSGIHGACIEFITNATIGGGYSWDNTELSAPAKVDLLTFEKKNKLKKLTRLLTRDYIIHKRVFVIITRNNEGKVIRMTRIDPSTVRNYENNAFFVVAPDWSRGTFDTKNYKRYNAGDTKVTESLYVYQDESPGQDVYPIPMYNSILNWTNLDGDIAYFHKSNIQNAIFPSAVIRRPKEFGSLDEIEKFKSEIGGRKGAANGGRLIVLTGNGFDDTPKFESISAHSNDKLFENTKKDLIESVCIAHNINPGIMGIKVAGQLGNTQELETSYAIFEKNVVKPLRELMNEILNDLVDACKIPNTLTINNYKLDSTPVIITGSEDKDKNKLTDALNQMSPLVATKVLDNLTPNEIRNLPGLPGKPGGDKLPSLDNISNGNTI